MSQQQKDPGAVGTVGLHLVVVAYTNEKVVDSKVTYDSIGAPASYRLVEHSITSLSQEVTGHDGWISKPSSDRFAYPGKGHVALEITIIEAGAVLTRKFELSVNTSGDLRRAITAAVYSIKDQATRWVVGLKEDYQAKNTTVTRAKREGRSIAAVTAEDRSGSTPESPFGATLWPK